jgi:dephospho-CoA kinase
MTASRVRRIALTGGIATGKSHVRAMFEQLGVPTVDADALAHSAVAQGTRALDAIVARFGAAVLDAHGGLDRRRLAGIVFSDPAARLDLEQIVHPAVRAATEQFFRGLDPALHPFAIADIPLLYEVGRDKDFDEVIVVATDAATQERRVVHRDGVSIEEARQRIAAQLPIEEKVRRANHVIRTDGSLDDTHAQVEALWRLLSAPSG